MSGILESSKEGDVEERGEQRGGEGVSGPGHRASIIAVLTLGPGCHHLHLKLERLRLWANETEQGITCRSARGQTTFGLAL